MQLNPQLNQDRKQFVLNFFLKYPTFSVRKAQAALRASPLGPRMMRPQAIADIRTEARKQLEAMPATAGEIELKLSADAVGTQIPPPVQPLAVGGPVDSSTVVTAKAS